MLLIIKSEDEHNAPPQKTNLPDKHFAIKKRIHGKFLKKKEKRISPATILSAVLINFLKFFLLIYFLPDIAAADMCAFFSFSPPPPLEKR